MSTASKKPASGTTTTVNTNALDGLTSVNASFTFAVFVGLVLTAPGQKSLAGESCDVGPTVLRNLLIFEVVCFTCFLFSTLIAKGLMVAINQLSCNDNTRTANIDSRFLCYSISTCAGFSFLGCVFLTLSIIHIVLIRLGMPSCAGTPVVITVAVVSAFSFVALVFFFVVAVFNPVYQRIKLDMAKRADV